MTKKHFIKLADYLKDSGAHCEPFTHRQKMHLANFCHTTNPNFDRERFLKACDVNTGPIRMR